MFEQINAKQLFLGRIKSKLIDKGFFNTTTTVLNEKEIILHDIASNNLLKTIAIYGWDGFEPELKKFIENYSFDVDCFLDGGANVGFYSIVFSQSHKDIKTIAIEALDRNITYMENLKKNNNLNFEIMHNAIDTSCDSEIEFFIPKNIGKSKLSANGSVIKKFRDNMGYNHDIDYEIKRVKTVTLEALLENSKDALVKLDIEGNEFRVMEHSLKKLVDKNIDFVLEIMINDTDKKELFELMKSNGYNGYLITNAGLVAEERALTLPYPYVNNRTLWKNHYFTKKPLDEIAQFSVKNYGYFI